MTFSVLLFTDSSWPLLLWLTRVSWRVERTSCHDSTCRPAPDNLDSSTFNSMRSANYSRPHHLQFNQTGRWFVGNYRDYYRSWFWSSRACTQTSEWKSSAVRTVTLCFCILTRRPFSISGSWCPSNYTYFLQSILKICSTGCLHSCPLGKLLPPYWRTGLRCPSCSAWDRCSGSRTIFSWQYAWSRICDSDACRRTSGSAVRASTFHPCFLRSIGWTCPLFPDFTLSCNLLK